MSDAAPTTDPHVGVRLRALRGSAGVSAAELGRRIGISTSAVSQIERGVMQPSVARLIAITDALGVPLAAAFRADDDVTPAEGIAVTRSDDAAPLSLGGGVTFRRLAPGPTPGVDYFESVYPPGSTATAKNRMLRHEGYEVGEVTRGMLSIEFSDETVDISPGDTISYPCHVPHRIHNRGSEVAVARWLIVHPAS
ncbi:helix-turn-helix domain-containing protein [Microbacterium excoecariae]|uniref:helix-turn-helix domain-containing protein n=1 Tax=Microbacterium excoecariae TaxID=2715210 RepID=UPI001408DA2A|nr:XRE family transcriptional regulator [Microbacterium excoecariae]NHI16130.1 helix-turn-helix domain-containing protein [Microbacterium excoecariae]